MARHVQLADGKLEREAATLPGHWPGIYGCEYKNLSTIYLHTATARLAVLQENFTLAEVCFAMVAVHMYADA